MLVYFYRILLKKNLFISEIILLKINNFKLSRLDPGPFGTLGCGAGFALGIFQQFHN